MIICNVIGGLGNQMFQYAAGRALAEKHGVGLKLDTRMFDNYKLHNGFELDRVFQVDASIASNTEIKELIGWRATRAGQHLLNTRKWHFLRGSRYIVESKVTFEAFFFLPASCYLFGYWQSERYFDCEETLIRNHFTFNSDLTGENKDVADIIKSVNSVSIHVRRGDYIADEKTYNAHGTCSIQYYQKAMKYIQQHVHKPVYIIFSDDIPWIEKHLTTNHEHYFINHNCGIDSYIDMQLMALCKHHVIANSSFSWWGAWLNADAEKIVVAPRQWFRNAQKDSSKVLPSGWISI